MKQEKSCGAIIIHNNQVLLIQQNQGFWGFPKGHVEGEETEIETAIREVKEETNLDIVVDETLRFENRYITDKNVDKTVILFVGRPVNDINVIPQIAEIKNIKWVDWKEAEDIITFDNLKEVWRKAYTKFFR